MSSPRPLRSGKAKRLISRFHQIVYASLFTRAGIDGKIGVALEYIAGRRLFTARSVSRLRSAPIREPGGDPKTLAPDLDDDVEGEIEAIETTAETFESAESVLEAINSGSISKAEGRQILIDEFGFTAKQ